MSPPLSSKFVPTRATSLSSFGSTTLSLTVKPFSIGVMIWVCLIAKPVLVFHMHLIVTFLEFSETVHSSRVRSRNPQRSHLVEIWPIRSLSVGARHNESTGATNPNGS